MQSLKALLTPEDDAARLRAKMSRSRARSEGAQPAGDHPHAAGRERQGAARQVRRPRRLRTRRLLLARCRHASTATSRPTPSIDDFVLWIFRKAIEGFASDRPGGLAEHPARLRQPPQRPSQPGRAGDARQARGRRPRLQVDASRTRASATSSRSTCSRRPTRRSSATSPRAVAEQTVTAREVAEVVRARQSSVWIDGYRQLYTAIGSAVGAAGAS